MGSYGVPLPPRNRVGGLYKQAGCAEPAELWQEKSNEAAKLMWDWPPQETFCLWGQWGRGRRELSMKE